MALFNLFPRPRVSKKTKETFEQLRRKEQERLILEEAKKGRRRERLKTLKTGAKRSIKAPLVFPTKKEGEQIIERFGEFVGRGTIARPDFSTEQEALKSMFGGGDRVWGRQDSQPVTLHHDLNPRQRGDNSTAELFGF